MAAATTAAATLLAASTGLSDTHSISSVARAEATSLDLDPSMRALGKSLQQSHERQMVRMAKLLHSLEILAEEAGEDITNNATKEEEDIENNQTDKRNSDASGENEHSTNSASTEGSKNNNRIIHISQKELANLSSSPKKVWKHIESLKNGCIYGREDVKRIVRAASKLLCTEPSLIDISHRCSGNTKTNTDVPSKDGDQLKTVMVVGDLHGHFGDSLLKVLDMVGNKKYGTPWDGSGAVIFNGGTSKFLSSKWYYYLTLLCTFFSHMVRF